MPKSAERLIHRFDARAFFDQELCFAAVRTKHAIADKAAAVADEHADFAELFRKLHAGGDHFLEVALPRTISSRRITFAGLKKCVPMTNCGPRRGGSDFVDVQRGSIAGEDGAGLADAIELAENFFLQRHAFEDGFDNQVGVCEIVIDERRRDALQAFFGNLLREAAALDGIRVVRLDGGESAIERGLVGFFEQHGNAGVGENHGDAAAHGAGANDRRGFYGN